MKTQTSTTDPIRVDFVPADVTGLPGRIGMTFAPGKKAEGSCEVNAKGKVTQFTGK